MAPTAGGASVKKPRYELYDPTYRFIARRKLALLSFHVFPGFFLLTSLTPFVAEDVDKLPYKHLNALAKKYSHPSTLR